MSTRIVWIDIETTGLDPTKDEVLEIGCLITEADLREVASTNVVLPITENGRARLADNAYVTDMHTRGGLLAECEALASAHRGAHYSDLLQRAAEPVSDFILTHTPPEGRITPPVMAGSTIGFDRRFLEGTPILALCSYRSIDVSSLKELTRLWGLRNAPPLDTKAHRAIADIRASIAELRFYREKLFFLEGV